MVMKNYRRNLPSLGSLVFFEAAARHLSFTRAATELYVTQAAVSKRIQQLEISLGVGLFDRNGRNLSLTHEGERLKESTGMVLDYLESIFQTVSSMPDHAISISANSAVSMFWLQPRMKVFGLSDHACAVNLITNDKTNDQLSSETDLAIIFGEGSIPGWTGIPILEERLVPVATPSYVERLNLVPHKRFTSVVTVADPTLLNYPRLGPESNNWDTWAEKLDLLEILNWPQLECATYAQSIGKAMNGEGVALASVSLIENELKTGQLRCLCHDALVSSRKYLLAHPQARPMRDSTKQVFDFLVQQAEQQEKAEPLAIRTVS